MAILPPEVRLALGEIDAEELSDDVIEAAIDYAETVVGNFTPDSVDLAPDVEDQMVRAVAAREAFMSAPRETRMSALDLTTEWNVEEYVAYLDQRVEQAFEMMPSAKPGRTVTSASPGRRD